VLPRQSRHFLIFIFSLLHLCVFFFLFAQSVQLLVQLSYWLYQFL